MKLPRLLLLLVACAGLAAGLQGQTKAVTKTISTGAITEDLTIPSGRTVTFATGAAIVLPDNALAIGDVTGLQTALDAKQPLDSDLTSIAGLSTTSFGRSLLTQADAAATRTTLATLQAETIAFEARVAAAGGRVGGQALAALDAFVARGKSVGWWTNLRDVWVPVGDYAASQIKLLDGSTGGVGAIFYNNSAAYYTEGFGYRLSSNSNFYVDTNFDLALSPISASNVMFAFASTDDITSSSLRFIVGTTTTSENAVIGFSNHDGRFGVNTGPTANIDRLVPAANAPYVISGRWGTDAREVILNGTRLSTESGSQSNSLTGRITLFRSHNTGGTQFAFGGLGLWAIGTAPASMEVHRDFNRACYDLMRSIRLRYREPVLITFGDSITAGREQISSSDYRPTLRWGGILARSLGMRELNTAQSGSAVNGSGTLSYAVAGITRHTDLLAMPGNVMAVIYGTNDMQLDGAADGTAGTLATLTANLTTIATTARQANRLVVFGGPPVRTSTQNATKQAAYQAAVAAAAKDTGSPFADLYRLFADLGDNTFLQTTYFPDHIHPNDAGHRLIAEAMLRAYRGVLYRRPPVDLPSIAAGAVGILDVTVLNVEAGMSVRLTPAAALEAGLVVLPPVASTDSVQVRVLNTTAGAIDPAPLYYTIEATR